MNYAVDLYKLCRHLVPPHLQGGRVLQWTTRPGLFWATRAGQAWSTGSASRQMAWVRVLTGQVQALLGQFVALVADVRYRLSMTGQVIYLEHLLNDHFDLDQRRIYITDGAVVVDPLFIYLKPNPGETLTTKADTSTDPLVLYNRADYAANVDFVIHIPSDLTLTTSVLALLRALVARYKLAGARYRISQVGGQDHTFPLGQF